jgi:hypothetical protein
MGFLDKFRGNSNTPATLPRGARVTRRTRRRGNSSDVGYWHNNSFYLLDGTLVDSADYLSGPGEVLSTREARSELADSGYNADSYTTPSTPSYETSGYSSQSAGTATYGSESSSGHGSGSYGGSSSGGNDSGYSSGGGYSGGGGGGYSDSGGSSGGGSGSSD